ncbi:hypothetical protein ACSNOI_42835 [Actinomadura kijaniata]|uniref:hypothetical protein n=1 Tax=Actinomadura kijaniata TaxID=46161 RepID=UPI003F1BF71C
MKKLPDPRALLDGTDWDALGADWAQTLDDDPAGPRRSLTPLALAALTCGDRDAVSQAMNHLGGTLLHQGSLYAETGTAALYVAALLADPGSQQYLDPSWKMAQKPLRSHLLAWLAAVAQTVSDHEEKRRRRWGESWESLATAREVRALRPVLFQGVGPYLDAPDQAVREAALGTAVLLLDDPRLVHHRASLVPAVRGDLATSVERAWRFIAVRGLQAWGESTATLSAHSELLEHERQEEERRKSSPVIRIDKIPPF